MACWLRTSPRCCFVWLESPHIGDWTTRLMPILVFSCLLHTGSSQPEDGCRSPQYLELWKPGVISCTFSYEHLAVAWFNSSLYQLEVPLIRLRDSGKEGIGYRSGKYDILGNGSLLIKNVSLEHEHVYSVLKIEDPVEDSTPYIIEVFTIVYPEQRYPQITNCSIYGPRICYAEYRETSAFQCSVVNARPVVQLVWESAFGYGDISNGTSIDSSGAAFTSHALLTDPILYSHSSLTLFVCKAASQPRVLSDDNAFLLLENMDADVPSVKPIKVHAEKGSTTALNCSHLTGKHLLAWNLAKRPSDDHHMVAFAVIDEYIFTSTPVSKNYALSAANSSLIIHDVGIEHNGTYTCIATNGSHEVTQVYHVLVYAPAFPEVNGCNPDRYCVLRAEDHEKLTCRIRGVPQDVRLEFRVVYSATSQIYFRKPVVTIHQAGDFYDVLLSTPYQVTYTTDERVTIECRVIHPNDEVFGETAVLTLLLNPVSAPAITEKPVLASNGRWELILRAVSVVLLMAAVITVVIACCCCGFKVSRNGQNRDGTPPQSYQKVDDSLAGVKL